MDPNTYEAQKPYRLIDHLTGECNELLTITPDPRDPDNGGASHEYYVENVCTTPDDPPPSVKLVVNFQRGPLKENGVNGVTNEALLAIVADRLRGFQSSKWACSENANALTKIEEALQWLHGRTRERKSRGVEGTSAV